MYGAALLKTINDAGLAVMILTEGLEDSELLASRLTRAEVTRQLRLLIQTTECLPQELTQGMPEIDWRGLTAAGVALSGRAGPALDDALMFAIRSLVPATLMWLRVYQQQQPGWFRMVPAMASQ
jgi:hypothetical protein